MDKSGFTLAELLIALAILAVIATFTISKIMHGQSDTEKKAIFKESISTIWGVFENARLYNTINFNADSGHDSAEIYDELSDNLNYLRRCPVTDTSCWTYDHPSGTGKDRTFNLANGSDVAIVAAQCQTGTCQARRVNMYFDFNGPEGNNTQGDDQLVLTFSLGPEQWCDGFGCIAGGRVRAIGTSKTLYESIFD